MNRHQKNHIAITIMTLSGCANMTAQQKNTPRLELPLAVSQAQYLLAAAQSEQSVARSWAA